MALDQLTQIADQHRQKYLDSCAGSAIEMLLKLNGAVPSDFYQYQDAEPPNELFVFLRDSTDHPGCLF